MQYITTCFHNNNLMPYSRHELIPDPRDKRRNDKVPPVQQEVLGHHPQRQEEMQRTKYVENIRIPWICCGCDWSSYFFECSIGTVICVQISMQLKITRLRVSSSNSYIVVATHGELLSCSGTDNPMRTIKFRNRVSQSSMTYLSHLYRTMNRFN